ARFWQRLERHLARLDTAPPPAPLAPPPEARLGSAEQARVVEQLARAFTADTPRRIALVAERGRGKSSALGLALAAALAARPELRARVTAPSPDAAAELFRFAPADPERVRFAAVTELLEPGAPHDDAALILVDEAAQLPVAALQALVARHPRATLA